MTINNSVKIKIIADYLSGMKREDIAKRYGISTGSVSAIAEEYEEEIPDIHKIRAMMVKLKATGNNPKLFYSAIRLHNYIKSLDLTETSAEHILEIFQEYAFKKKYNPSEIIDGVINAFNIAQKCGTDLEHLDEYANAKKVVVEAMEAQARKLRNDIELLPHKLNIDLTDFQEYLCNKPTFQEFINMKTDLGIKERRIKSLEDQVDNLDMQVVEKDREIERLNSLFIQQEKKEDEDHVNYQEDITNLDTADHLVDNDSNDEENNM